MICAEKYKPSRFNYYYQYDENTFLVFNTFKNKLYKISEECYAQMCREQEIYYDPSLDPLLLENLLVPAAEDEDVTLYHLIRSDIYSNRLEVSIMPTQACNFRCTYCFEEHLPYKMDDEAEKRVIRFFERNTKNYQSIHISWFGGEPLLEKQRVIRIMEAAKKASAKHKIPLVANMVTNGYDLDYATFTLLVKNGVWEFQITVDGDRERHDQSRPLANGKGTFDKIVQNLIEIHHYPGSCRIAVRTNMDKTNVDAYPAFVDKMKAILEYDKRFAFEPNKIEDLGANIEDKNLLLDRADDLPVRLDPQAFMRHENIIQYRCVSGAQHSFAIAHDATIHKCRLLPYNTNSKIDRSFSCCGYIAENGTLVIDESKNAQYISLLQPTEDCKICIWLPQCAALTCPHYAAKHNVFDCRKSEDVVKLQGLRRLYENQVYIDLSI